MDLQGSRCALVGKQTKTGGNKIGPFPAGGWLKLKKRAQTLRLERGRFKNRQRPQSPPSIANGGRYFGSINEVEDYYFPAEYAVEFLSGESECSSGFYL
ncbi:hypothetical protein QQP08_024253 [Theobroma cacao]|nr:hypothetical protein QQP08_024253 [Theobroma cacao]